MSNVDTSFLEKYETVKPLTFKLQVLWFLLFLAGLLISGYHPYEQFTWFLEVAPALVAVFILIASRNSFPLTPMVYVLILFHTYILMVGGHYTYAKVPAFDWLRDTFELSRNHYDKVGHFIQGFVPAMVVREVLLRKTPMRKGGWLFFLVSSVCLAVSAVYEFIEWWVALAIKEDAESFLGTQGYVWDTQSDMFLALVGAILAQLFLNRWHDRQLKG